MLVFEFYTLLTPNVGARELSDHRLVQVVQPPPVVQLLPQLGYVLVLRQVIRMEQPTDDL